MSSTATPAPLRSASARKRSSALTDQRMYDCFKFFDRSGVAQYPLGKFFAVYLAAGGVCRKGRLNQWRRVGIIEPVHGRIRIVNRHALLGEHLRRGGFSHPKRAGETENKHWLAIDELILPEKGQQRQKR